MPWDFRRYSDPLIARNTYKQPGPSLSEAVPGFDVARSLLPAPVLPEDPVWLKLYWLSWEKVWERLRLGHTDSLVGPVIGNTRFAGQDIETTCFIARLSGYSHRAFDLIHLLDNYYAQQDAGGFISREFSVETGEPLFAPFDPNGAGPSLLAWTEWRRYRLTGDEERLKQSFWPMMANHRWCRRNRTWPSGLYWATGYSSGLVNQPAVPEGRFHHQHWSWLDASLQAALNGLLLGRVATMLGEEGLVAELSAEHSTLVEAINARLWNEDAGFYQDVSPSGQFSRVKRIAAYWALIDRQLVPKERQSRIVQPLREAAQFKTPYRIPSVSADSDQYEGPSGNGWRGAIWPHLNYVVMRGLRSVGQHMLLYEIARDHIEQIARVYDDTGVLWSSYAPEMLGAGDPAEVDSSGLTAASVILHIIEALIGVSIDWPLRQVIWHRFHQREEPYGIRNLVLGDQGTLDLVGNREFVRVNTNVPLTLVIRDGLQETQLAVPAGQTEIPLDAD